MKKSLTLIAGLTLLAAPLSIAKNPLSDGEAYLAIGSQTSVIGNPTAAPSAAKTVLAGTRDLAPTGTVTAIASQVTTLTFGASGSLSLNDKFGVKLAGEIHVPNSTTQTIHDGQSQSATVVLKSLPGQAAVIANPVPGKVGVLSAIGSKQELTLTPSTSYGVKMMVSTGDAHFGGSIGPAVLVTNNEYGYLLDTPAVTGTENGYVDTSSTGLGNSSPTLTEGFSLTNPQVPVLVAADIGTHTYSPVAGVADKVNDTKTWYGVSLEGSTAFNESISINAALDFYYTTFDASPNPLTKSAMVTKSTDAKMVNASFGIGIRKDF
jgi:hypothetical protein